MLMIVCVHARTTRRFPPLRGPSRIQDPRLMAAFLGFFVDSFSSPGEQDARINNIGGSALP